MKPGSVRIFSSKNRHPVIDLVLIRVLQRELVRALGVVAADLNGRRILQKRLNAGNGQELRLQRLDHLIGGQRAFFARLEQHEKVAGISAVHEREDAVDVRIVLA